MNKFSKYLPAAVVVLIILVIAGIQMLKQKKPSNEGNNPPQSQEQTRTDDSKTSAETPGMLEGTLQISNDLKRGNLMLVTPERVIYLFTSRDYSTLLEKQVRLEIEGTLENFRLVDIVAK